MTKPSMTFSIGGDLPATDLLQLVIEAARTAADNRAYADAVDLDIFASALEEQSDMVSPKREGDRPFVVVGGDDEPLLRWASSPTEAALADLATMQTMDDVEYEGLEMDIRADERRRDQEDFFRCRAWDSWPVRVYDVLTADLTRSHGPIYGDETSGGRLPLVGTFIAHRHGGDEVGRWEWARGSGPVAVADRQAWYGPRPVARLGPG